VVNLISPIRIAKSGAISGMFETGVHHSGLVLLKWSFALKIHASHFHLKSKQKLSKKGSATENNKIINHVQLYCVNHSMTMHLVVVADL
jgi:hypothetical protein